MSDVSLSGVICDHPGCLVRWVAKTVGEVRELVGANRWQRVYELSKGILLFLDYCPEHYVTPTFTCRRGHAIVFDPSPWATNQRKPARCPACDTELTP